MKLTVGDWCSQVPGILNSVGLTWQKDYVWDLGQDAPGDSSKSSGLILPHVLDVQVQFTPIHNFLPEKSFNSKFLNVPTVNRKAIPEGVSLTPKQVNQIENSQNSIELSRPEVQGTVEVDPLIFNVEETRDLRAGETFDDGTPVLTPTTYN